jgi:hypothetical protein
MRVKINPKNQITLPHAVVQGVGGPKFFDVRAIAGRIVLTPAQASKAYVLRDQLNSLRLTKRDIADAVAWARRG